MMTRCMIEFTMNSVALSTFSNNSSPDASVRVPGREQINLKKRQEKGAVDENCNSQ